MTTRSLLPREHGAYAELLFPVITGLALGRPGLGSAAFAVVAVLAFLIYEPLAVATGVRGERARTELADGARRRAVLLVGGMAGAILVAAAAAPSSALAAALIPMACLVGLIPLALRNRIKTLPGEILVIGAFSSTLLPIALASRVDWLAAWVAAGVWFVSFTLGTLTVHAVKARAKPDKLPQWTVVAAPISAAFAMSAGALLAWTRALPVPTALALLPPGAAMLAIGVTGVHARRLRTVGWSLVVASAATAALLIAGR